jgi:hypothetical protein
MLQDTLAVVADTAQAVVDTVAVVTPPLTGSEIVLYLITALAGILSGYVVKLFGTLSTKISGLNEYLKVVIIGVLSFGSLKLGAVFGLTLPENPLSWDPTIVNTVLATLFGWVTTKAGLTKKAE